MYFKFGIVIFYTTVHFNKLKVSALIDTGSSVNIISEELYKSLPNSKKSDITVNIKDAIVLANNQTIDVIGTALIKMTISGVHQNIICYILKMSSNPIILGTEYLTENKVILDFSNKTPVSLNSNIYCTKRTTLPPNSEIMLWGKIHYGFYGMQGLCVSSRYVLCKGILVSKAVVSIAKNKQVPIKILNQTNDCVIVHKGKPLAHFTQMSPDYALQPVSNDHKVKNINLFKTETEISSSQSDQHDKALDSQDIDEFIHNFSFAECDLSSTDQTELEDFLYQNKDIFVTKDNPGLGFTDLVRHNIILKPDAKPKYLRPYRLSPNKKEVLRHHLDELLNQGIICTVDPSEDLPITSRVVLVTKRAKSKSEGPSYSHEDSISHFRFCCDFRYLNSMTQNISYVIPDLQELTESFTERTPNFITTIDLSQGFFQMELDPQSSKYTAFNTCFGTFKFQRLPMGLSSSPNSFQLLIQSHFKCGKSTFMAHCLCHKEHNYTYSPQ